MVSVSPTEFYLCGDNGQNGPGRKAQIFYLDTSASPLITLLVTDTAAVSSTFNGISKSTSNIFVVGYTNDFDSPGFIYVGTPPCLLPGSKILLSDMTYKAIEDLQKGDLIIGALSRKPKAILGVSSENVSISSLPESNRVYKISKNVISNSIPKDDVFISGHHRVFTPTGEVSDEKLTVVTAIPAYRLEIAKPTDMEGKVLYYHLQVEDDDGFFVSGLGVESFVQNNI